MLTAVKVNKQGPFCGLCMHLEMARRFAEGRGITLRVEQFRVPAQTTGEPETAGAVDPHVADPGKPSTRDKGL